MRIVFGCLIATAIVLAVGFAIDLGDPRRTDQPAAAWLWSAIAWVSASLNSILLLVTARLPIPVWLLYLVSSVVLVGQVGVFAWRWWVLRRIRRVDREAAKPPA